MFINNTKYNCGPIVPSPCIPFQGKRLTILNPGEELPCDASINDVVEIFDTKVKKLIVDSDFSLLDKKCLDFDPKNISNKGLHQIEINAICGLDARLKTVEDNQINLNISNELITLNLGGLAPSAEACEVSTNTYKLITIINILVNEINTLKANL